MSGELVYVPIEQRRCALYRHFDTAGVLLYVGISDSPVDRTNGHARTSEWVQFASRAEVYWYETRETAARAERDAIEDEEPVFNRQFAVGDVDARIAEYKQRREVAELEGIIGVYEHSMRVLSERLPGDVFQAAEHLTHQEYEFAGRSTDRCFRAHLLRNAALEIGARLCRSDDDARAEAYADIVEYAAEKLKPILARDRERRAATEAPF